MQKKLSNVQKEIYFFADAYSERFRQFIMRNKENPDARFTGNSLIVGRTKIGAAEGRKKNVLNFTDSV